MKALKDSDKDKHEAICSEVREDGAYVDSGENDNLIVQKIEANPKAIGVFGFSFLEENVGKLEGITVDGIAPTYASISDFSYPGARPLYIYVKAAHLSAIKGLKEYVAEWAKSLGQGRTARQAGHGRLARRRADRQRQARDRFHPARPGQPEVRIETAPMSPAVLILLAFGLGLAAWLAARSRAWAFQRARRGERAGNCIRCPAIMAGTSRCGRRCPALLFARSGLPPAPRW